MFKTWKEAHDEAIKRAVKHKIDYYIMKNAFGEFSIGMVGDVSDRYKYEIVNWKEWQVTAKHLEGVAAEKKELKGWRGC